MGQIKQHGEREAKVAALVAKFYRAEVAKRVKKAIEAEERQIELRRECADEEIEMAFRRAIAETRKAVKSALERNDVRLDHRLQTLGKRIEELRCRKPGVVENLLSGGKKLRVWKAALREAKKAVEALNEQKQRIFRLLECRNDATAVNVSMMVADRVIRENPAIVYQAMNSRPVQMSHVRDDMERERVEKKEVAREAAMGGRTLEKKEDWQ